MFRYRLRTLLIMLAILPPLLAFGWWKYSAWRAEQAAAAARQQFVAPLVLAPVVLTPTQIAALPAREAALELLEARMQASGPKRLDERAEDATPVDRLLRAGYLPFPATPRIQPQPTAPPAAPIET